MGSGTSSGSQWAVIGMSMEINRKSYESQREVIGKYLVSRVHVYGKYRKVNDRFLESQWQVSGKSKVRHRNVNGKSSGSPRGNIGMSTESHWKAYGKSSESQV